MSNTSATGGYLQPAPQFPTLPGGLTFRQFIQTVFAGVSGLPGDLVRPRWQVEPAKNPDITVNWLAIGLTSNKPDANAFTGQSLGSQAKGFVNFKFNPQPGDAVTINGVTITFVQASPGANQVLIGVDQTETAVNLAAFLISSSNVNLILASYAAFYHQVTITAVAVGTAGNAFTLATNSAALVLSGATLENGSASNNQMQRHEDLEVQCAFYGPDSDEFAAMVRDGFYMQQNLEVLRSAQMGFVGTSEMTHVPDLLNERWVDRYEMSFFFRREILRVYPILSFSSVSGIVEAVVSENLKTVAWQTNT